MNLKIYKSSNLPQKGPSITYSLFKTLNSLTDGIIAAVLIIISGLLMLIAMLCIRFTIITSMEEDYREIGVMKAIGIHNKDIQNYIIKYFISAGGCICGYTLTICYKNLHFKYHPLYGGGK